MRDSFPWCQTCQSAGCSHCKEYNAAGFQAPQADPRNSPTWAPCSCGGSAETGHMPACRKFLPAQTDGQCACGPDERCLHCVQFKGGFGFPGPIGAQQKDRGLSNRLDPKAPSPDGLEQARDRLKCDLASGKIRDRLAELERIKANYLEYLHCRISESDWHGAWDASVNISETECEMAGLRFALEAIG